MSPKERLAFGRSVFEKIPQNHQFKRNEIVGDHKTSDAGFYDLLLHSQDIACTVQDVVGFLETAGLELASFTQPAMYSLDGLLPPEYKLPDGLSRVDEMHLAEKLRGNMKIHVGSAVKVGASVLPDPNDPLAIPHFIGEDPKKAESFILKRGGLPVAINGQKIGIGIPPVAAKLLGMIDGVATVGQLQKQSGLLQAEFDIVWKTLSELLSGYGILLYSRLNKR